MEQDLRSLQEHCKQMNFTQEEIEKLYEPLNYAIEKAKILKKLRKILIFLSIVLTLYALSYFEFFAWNYSAIGRIILIKILPLWNWKNLKNERCLIYNDYFYTPNTGTANENIYSNYLTDCTFCEAIEKVPAVDLRDENTETEYLKNSHHVDSSNFEFTSRLIQEKYLNLDIPVILTDDENQIGQHWPKFREIQNLTKFFNVFSNFYDEEFLSSRPCYLKSNVLKNEETVEEIFSKIHDQNFASFFAHFQNCDFETSVKKFRKFAPRPKFLVDDLSPVQYSWVLMSKNYNVSKFKKIQLRDKITVIGQVLGWNIFRLVALKNCAEEDRKSVV